MLPNQLAANKHFIDSILHIHSPNDPKLKIVVARYNENVDWTLSLPNVTIFNKGPWLDPFKYNTVNGLKNVGREGHTFYTYIYQNYDCLDDYTLFLQGNPFDHMPDIMTVINKLLTHPITIDFAMISRHILNTNLIKCPYHIGHDGKLPLMRVFYELFGYYKHDLEFPFGAGNQFIVSKRAILQHPREFYSNISNMLAYDNCPIEGYVIERFQYLFFAFSHSLFRNERSIAISSFLHDSSIRYNKDDIVMIPFNTSDRGVSDPTRSPPLFEYSMCYNKNYPELARFCIPDCFFHNWSSANIHSFESIKVQIIEASDHLPIIHKVGWVGNIHSPLPDVIEYTTRPLLKQIGDTYSQWFDIIHVSPNEKGIIGETNPGYLSLVDLIKTYSFLIDIGGNGWSGRLKFLLFSKRPLLLVDRVYIEYFYTYLIPYVHYIPVKSDLSDLMDQTKWLYDHPEKAAEMARNAFDFAVENFVMDKFTARVYYAYSNIVAAASAAIKERK